jgi:hypothetical protein
MYLRTLAAERGRDSDISLASQQPNSTDKDPGPRRSIRVFPELRANRPSPGRRRFTSRRWRPPEYGTASAQTRVTPPRTLAGSRAVGVDLRRKQVLRSACHLPALLGRPGAVVDCETRAPARPKSAHSGVPAHNRLRQRSRRRAMIVVNARPGGEAFKPSHVLVARSRCTVMLRLTVPDSDRTLASPQAMLYAG